MFKPRFICGDKATGWSDRLECLFHLDVLNGRQAEEAESDFKVEPKAASFKLKDKVELMKGSSGVMLCDWYRPRCQPRSTGRSGMMTDELVCWQSAWRDG